MSTPDKHIINVLPAHIANQIAAGEVVQSPSHIIKELMENALDAGAKNIQLYLHEAGKARLRVVDDGVGMSHTDALLSVQKHATSKIKTIDDLYRLHTMGFRGEALAAICAVCRVTLKTKRVQDTAGTLIEIDNGARVREEPVAMAQGTDITVRNLFFNIPARKVFLHSDKVENERNFREFLRIALPYHDRSFSLFSDEKCIYRLPAVATLMRRVLQIFPKRYDGALLPIDLKTDYVHLHGVIGKPAVARKMRGDQFFFMNGRFIREIHFHQAIMQAFQNLIPPKSYPFYAIHIDIDPSKVDVNIHPSKQEVKFEDENILFNYLKAAVQKALDQFCVVPSIDFSLDPQIQNLPAMSENTPAQWENNSLLHSYSSPNRAHLMDHDLEKLLQAKSKNSTKNNLAEEDKIKKQNGDYTSEDTQEIFYENKNARGFNDTSHVTKDSVHKNNQEASKLSELYDTKKSNTSINIPAPKFAATHIPSSQMYVAQKENPEKDKLQPSFFSNLRAENEANSAVQNTFYDLQKAFLTIDWNAQNYLQLRCEWILCDTPRGLLFLHQQRAHEYILLDKLKQIAHKKTKAMIAQRLLFPVPLHIAAADFATFQNILPALQSIGYEITPEHEQSGMHTFSLTACPSIFDAACASDDIDIFMHAYKYDKSDITLNTQERIMRYVARKNALKVGQVLTGEAMQSLVASFFALAHFPSTESARAVFLLLPPKYPEAFFNTAR